MSRRDKWIVDERKSKTWIASDLHRAGEIELALACSTSSDLDGVSNHLIAS
jgi:hypothetical protein